jgi:transposase-like protein
MSESILSQPYFHNEEAAYEFVEARVWPHGRVCPHCGVIDRSGKLEGKSTRVGVYKCYDCRKPFTVKVGTIFESSHIALRLWLQAIFLIASSKKGISSNQLHRTLGITLKSAWFMSHRIREAMRDGMLGQLGGVGKIVEADETYYGSETGSKKAHGRAGKALTQMNKVVSLVERGGKVRSFHVPEVTGATLKAILEDQIDRESHVMTDSSPRYNVVKRNPQFAAYDQVNHSQDEYVRGNAYTNTVEGYFSILKRGLVGTYHHVSSQHLHRYTNEFDFRYNNRIALGVNDQQRAVNLLRGVVGKRLTYQTAH